jgi:hypothetical protein
MLFFRREDERLSVEISEKGQKRAVFSRLRKKGREGRKKWKLAKR